MSANETTHRKQAPPGVTPPTRSLGLAIQIARLRRGYYQRDTAVAADLSPSTLSQIENGWRAPSADELGRICKVLDIDPADLEAAP